MCIARRLSRHGILCYQAPVHCYVGRPAADLRMFSEGSHCARTAAYVCRSSKEISDLEGELRSIHSLLTAQANVLRTLVERPSVVTAASDKADDGLLDAEGDAAVNLRRDRGLLEIPEQMIVCLAERNFPKALQLLEQGEGELLVIRTRMRSGAVQLVGAPTVEELEALDEQLQERRADLLKLLADLTTQPSVTRQELKQAVSAIAALGDGSSTATAVLLLTPWSFLLYGLKPPLLWGVEASALS